MTLERCDDWDLRLYDRITEWQEKTFVYGMADCCAFCGDCVEAMTGVDPWVDWQGEYNDAKSGAKLIRARGHRSLFFVLQSIFGRPVHIAFAQRGDIVYGKLGLETAQLGICLGEASVSCAPDGTGLIQVPTLGFMKRAFHV